MERTLLQRLDTPIACLFAWVFALSLFTLGQFARSGFDPSAFIVAGDRYAEPRAVSAGVTVLEHSDGYDGQFYYRLALDPFTSKATDHGITLDNPAYRHQRILYPLIAHVVAFGDPARVAGAMIATNFAFFCALAWIAGHLAQVLGRHALWGLLIVAYPGFLVSDAKDLVEIVEAAFVLGSVLLVRRGRIGWATASLVLAILTRETSLIVAVAAAAAFGVERLRSRVPPFDWRYFTVPVVVFCAVQAALYANWGQMPIRAGSGVLNVRPLAGFGDSLSGPSAATPDGWRFQVVALAFVVLCSACVASRLFATRAACHERLACAFYAVLLSSVGTSVWAEDFAFLRVFAQFYGFGAIVVLASRSRPVASFMALLVGATWAIECYRLGSIGPLLRLVRDEIASG